MKVDQLLKIEADFEAAKESKNGDAIEALSRVVRETDGYARHLGHDIDDTQVRKCILLVITAYRLALPVAVGQGVADIMAQIAVLEPYLLTQ